MPGHQAQHLCRVLSKVMQISFKHIINNNNNVTYNQNAFIYNEIHCIGTEGSHFWTRHRHPVFHSQDFALLNPIMLQAEWNDFKMILLSCLLRFKVDCWYVAVLVLNIATFFCSWIILCNFIFIFYGVIEIIITLKQMNVTQNTALTQSLTVAPWAALYPCKEEAPVSPQSLM